MRLGLHIGIPGGAAGTEAALRVVTETFFADGTFATPAKFFGPDGVANRLKVEGWGAGGSAQINAGGGGGGEYRRLDSFAATPSTGYAFVRGAGANDADGGATTFHSTALVATGGLARVNGGTGGTGGTGDVGFNGGDGTAGTDTRPGGGSAGSSGAAAGATPGEPNGAAGAPSAANRSPGSGGRSTATTRSAGANGSLRVTYQIPATAGFPWLVAEIAEARSIGATTSLVATVPSGDVGDLLVAFVGADGVPDVSATGWTLLGQHDETGALCTAAVLYRVATGSDALTVALTASEECAVHVRRYRSAGTPEVAFADGSSTNADPPSLTPSGGSADYLWVAAVAWDSNTALTVTGFPSGYQGIRTGPQAEISVVIASTSRQATGSSENPGAFTSSTEQWVAATIAVPPA